uniref:RING-type domain-containing protein n=1 Tax=Ananas comosus var. bracteatus TaxID=296719 RepID=A0A6V7PDM0_ANACO|nr:unnamed protein product [Ananas comosus var. bracteatus]
MTEDSPPLFIHKFLVVGPARRRTRGGPSELVVAWWVAEGSLAYRSSTYHSLVLCCTVDRVQAWLRSLASASGQKAVGQSRSSIDDLERGQTEMNGSVFSARVQAGFNRKGGADANADAHKRGHELGRSKRQYVSNMTSACPFAKTATVGGSCPVKIEKNQHKDQKEHDDKVDAKSNDSVVSPKCPFGYDSHTFKLGPLSCMICQALLYQSSKCLPCSHKFCKACISRFKDCPLCGADIENIEPDTDLQTIVDRFIDGHARIKRSQLSEDAREVGDGQKKVIYEDVSMERGAFLVQQAMRAFRAQNFESAKSRLSLCAEDIREQLKAAGDSQELCSQLGAVLGMLGDCCRAMGDSISAVSNYEESAEILSKLPTKDLELVHTLSVSLNKIGDLRYYGGILNLREVIMHVVGCSS